MTDPVDAVVLHETADGLLLFGSDSALAALDAQPGLISKRLSAKEVARATGAATTAVGKYQAESGRWLKLTKESAELLRKHGDPAKGISGVVRRDKGKILKHLKFENLSKLTLANPAGLMLLASMATQHSLEASLDEITAYLEEMDAKLDRLLKQRKTETLGQLGGIALAIDEAAAIHQQSGLVSSVTWSKVQATSLTLQTMQAEALAHLSEVAQSISDTQGNADRAVKALMDAQEEIPFWLAVLAHTIALQDRAYSLELAHVADEDELQLDAHREGITTARAERLRRLGSGLEAINRALITASTLSNAAKVANPINAPRVTRLANSISNSITAFATRAQLDMHEGHSLETTSWLGAARGLATEAGASVADAGLGLVDRAKAMGQAARDMREDVILRQADMVLETRRRRSLASEQEEQSPSPGGPPVAGAELDQELGEEEPSP